MAEGYIVYESFYYASEYINQIDDTEGVNPDYFENEMKTKI